MTASLILPPALALFLGAAILTVARGWLRSAVMLLAPLAALGLVWMVPDASWGVGGYLGYDLVLVRGDRLSRWFGTIFAIMAFAGGLFALKQENRLETAAAQAYAGGALGVVFAGDVLTLFAFWEVMALASTAVIWSAGPEARPAGLRYLVMHLFGGVLLMTGLAGEVQATGSVAFTAMVPDTPARWLILAGFLINAGAPPLSAWLPDAYPRASYTGMVMLSAFTTKTAVFVLLRGFPGAEVLIWVGLFMVFYGIVYALLADDMRRILSFSIINQVGVMLTGIGVGTTLALDGAASHAFASVLYTALMLMAAGAVIRGTGRARLSELGGLFRSMPITTACGLIGVMTISGLPLTVGFVTKAMIGSAAAKENLVLVWYLMIPAAAGVALYAGCRFSWFAFFQRDSGLRPPDPPWNMRLAMVFIAALCLLLGTVPDLLYAHLPYASIYNPYDGAHVVSQMQIVVFAALAFVLMIGALRPNATITLDTDWLYRRLGLTVWRRTSQAIWTVWYLTSLATWTLTVQALTELRLAVREGFLSERHGSSTMAIFAVGMLVFYLAVLLIF